MAFVATVVLAAPGMDAWMAVVAKARSQRFVALDLGVFPAARTGRTSKYAYGIDSDEKEERA